MGLNADDLKTITGAIGTDRDGHSVVARLRQEYPELQFSTCSEDDLTEDLDPVAATEAFDLYLLDGGSHCLRLTRDLESATGLVLAEKIDD